MAQADLSKLRIKRGEGASAPGVGRRRKRILLIIVLLVAVAASALVLRYRATVPVEVATVSAVYPSQAYTMLNATGYVVAQRKAAVASKATGRLEWLGVREGSRVKEDEVLARAAGAQVRVAGGPRYRDRTI